MKKGELIELLKDPNDKLIAVDMDGTICKGEYWGSGEPEPIQEMIDFITSLYHRGGHIIIYTARQPKYYSDTVAWLLKYNVPFHGISMFIKCGADIYIDDKIIHPEDLKL